MKKYPKYNDSGVEWIGEIPEGWEVIPLKYLVTCNDDVLGEITESNKLINYIEIGDVSSTNGVENFTEFSFRNAPSRARRIVKSGDIIISTVRTYLKAITSITNKYDGYIVSTGFAVLRPKNIESKYLSYSALTSGIIEEIISKSKGVSYPSITSQELINIKIPFPSTREEQIFISNYLDSKTSEIDTLITNKEKLIELLKEERTAIINHAVTKGINPKAKLKPSGVEWIGEIPEHWEVKRLRNIVETVKTGSTPPSEEIRYFEPNEIDWFGPGDFDGLFLKDSKRKISKLAIDENKCRVFPSSSILLIGIGATVGKVGIVEKECCSNQQINAIILNKEEEPMFYLYYLSSIRDIIIMEASSATLPIFNQTQTKNLIITAPPKVEQKQIVDFINTKTSEIDAIISKTQKEIELLNEYKTALISEVVTGKVDVREEVIV